MKKYITIVVFLLMSCSTPKTPKELGKEICDCYNRVERITQNPDKQRELNGSCWEIELRNKEKLRKLGMDNNWPQEQVKEADDEFEAVLNTCGVDTFKP